MNPTILAALITLIGVVAGLLARDVVMALLLAKRRRAEALQDRSYEAAKSRLGDVRSYADPLLEAARSLRWRLEEIIEVRNVGYLLASAPATLFIEYKRISTAYRLAALLGWIRAFRRERSYLDPEALAEGEQTHAAICKIEEALADGQGVEGHRLGELLRLWHVPAELVSNELRAPLATDIEAQRHRFLTRQTSARHVDELEADEKLALVEACAERARRALNADIPAALVRATTEEAILHLQIREAYIYRDWQAAIGDYMIVEMNDGPRRFDVLGFGRFEDAHLSARSADSPRIEDRWFERLDALFYDLDMAKQGYFDARREQMRRLHLGLTELETVLCAKIEQLRGG